MWLGICKDKKQFLYLLDRRTVGQFVEIERLLLGKRLIRGKVGLVQLGHKLENLLKQIGLPS